MTLQRISRLKSQRVFRDFAWPSDLPDFARFNLIYGWNGSGKTTLSSLLRRLETKADITAGEADFICDGKVLSASSMSATQNVPSVRVFNQDFREANVLATTQRLKPIFFLGQDSVDKHKHIEQLTKDKENADKSFRHAEDMLSITRNSLDKYCKERAQSIKELLSSSGRNRYNNYDKSHFKDGVETLLKEKPLMACVTDEVKTLLRQKKDTTSKDALKVLVLPTLNLKTLYESVRALCERSVRSHTLNELLKAPDLAEWIRQGLALHSGDRRAHSCHFCCAALSDQRLAALRGHFNDEHATFLQSLADATANAEKAIEDLKALSPPDRAALYPDLVGDYDKALKGFRDYRKTSIAFLEQLLDILKAKRAKPFEPLAHDLLTNVVVPEEPDAAAATSLLNEVIRRHNDDTAQFDKRVKEARAQLERALVRDAIEDYDTRKNDVADAERKVDALRTKIARYIDDIRALEKAILQHRTPAEELTAELRGYLGRQELVFGVAGNGYQITRDGVPADNLSEGERTAITFLYFLKGLQGQGFSLRKGIVVIDDPVSSLDTNSLFSAFAYMKERTQDAGQLFILTHNFALFRQVKNWFQHLRGQKSPDELKRPARFYMLDATVMNGKRNAAVARLDPLLERYESEYHFLFRKVRDVAMGGGVANGLEALYGMPNIGRRLLEAFLAFRLPGDSGELKSQLDKIGYDSDKKLRLLRMLHTYSHDDRVLEGEHDVSILSETPEVLSILLDLMRTEDPKHFAEMQKLCAA